MSELSVWLKVDGREVKVCSLDRDSDEKFTPLQIAQLTALASNVVGRRLVHYGTSAFPDRIEDIEHVGDRFQRLLYDDGQKVRP